MKTVRKTKTKELNYSKSEILDAIVCISHINNANHLNRLRIGKIDEEKGVVHAIAHTWWCYIIRMAYHLIVIKIEPINNEKCILSVGSQLFIWWFDFNENQNIVDDIIQRVEFYLNHNKQII